MLKNFIEKKRKEITEKVATKLADKKITPADFLRLYNLLAEDYKMAIVPVLNIKQRKGVEKLLKYLEANDISLKDYLEFAFKNAPRLQKILFERKYTVNSIIFNAEVIIKEMKNIQEVSEEIKNNILRIE